MSAGEDWPRECAFCRIAHGIESARTVWEDDQTVAFFPLAPATVGHTLVIPKAHVPDLWAADRSLAGVLIERAIELGRVIWEVLTPSGMNLITSAGTDASQTIFHLHLHIVPRSEGDNMGELWPPHDLKTDARADEVLLAVREASHRAIARR